MDTPTAAASAAAEKSAAIDARLRRVRDAITVTGVLGLFYIVVLIGILSQLRTPLSPWVMVLFIPIPVVVIGLPVLRSWRMSLLADAARAAVAGALVAVDELEAEQKRVKRERRR